LNLLVPRQAASSKYSSNDRAGRHQPRAAAPTLGAHTEEVLVEAGLSGAQIEQLKDAKVFG